MLALLLLPSLLRTGSENPAKDLRPFNQWPAIMSHDAMTGEWHSATFAGKAETASNVTDRDPVADWGITQSAGLVQQLWCGARAFDYRPYCRNGEVLAHHGGFTINKKLPDVVAEVRAWLRAVPVALVLIYFSHADGDANCGGTVANWLAGLGIYTINCADVTRLTIAEVYARGLRSDLGQGGSLVAIFDCMDERFDDSVNCYTGFSDTCYSGPGDGGNEAWRRMKSYYVGSTLTRGGALWMTQLHWQLTPTTITYGTLHGSSVLMDEQRGGVNAWAGLALRNQGGSLAPQVCDNVCFRHNVHQRRQSLVSCPFPPPSPPKSTEQVINFVEVDNVCDHGTDIYQALLDTYPAPSIGCACVPRVARCTSCYAAVRCRP
jgi:hypothetical protein